MLKGIHPLLRGDVLLALDEIGHGDTFLIADANFPSHRISSRVIELPGVDTTTVLEAVLTVFPLDTFGGPALSVMTSVGDEMHGDHMADPIIAEYSQVAEGAPMEKLNRFDFYDATADVQFILRTGELRLYANIMLRKGVVSG